MNDEICKAQIETYKDLGYVVVEDLFSNDELECWRTAVDAGIDLHISKEMHHNQKEESYYKNVFTQCVNMWKSSEAVKELVLDPRLGKMAAELAGTEGMRLYHDHALIKQPWANPTHFHSDNPYDPFYSHQMITLWLALDDATLQNGCLCFLPGTHKSSSFEKHVGLSENMNDLFNLYPEWKEAEPKFIEVSAGDGIFFSGMTAHAAGPNMSPRPRRAFAMLFMPTGSTYNGQAAALPPEYAESLKFGDLLDNDEHLPLLYTGN